MDFAKRYPVLTAILALCVAAFAVEVFFLFRFRGQADAALRQRNAAESRLTTALAAQPAPTDANLQAAQKNVSDLTTRRNEIIASLSADTISSKFPPTPATGIDLLTAIQGYVDTLTNDAKSHNVIFPPSFTFGMGQYVGSTPPPSNKIPVVYRQMCALEYILKHLINDARGPQFAENDQELYLVSVEREDVAASGPASPDGANAKETFTIEPLVSARVPGAVDTLAFRIKFISYTSSLQSLLVYLAKFDLPLVVRSVDVAAVTGDRITSLRSTAGAPEKTPDPTIGANLEPIVTQNFSEFTVVIELITVIPPKSADAGEAPAEAPDATDPSASPASQDTTDAAPAPEAATEAAPSA